MEALDRERASAKKGTQVNHTTSSAPTPLLRTVTAARLAGSLRDGGSGAPSDDVGRRPRRASHHAGGGGHTSRTGVLGPVNGAAINGPCAGALLGPALAIAAPVPAGSPPTAVTATAKGMGESK